MRSLLRGKPRSVSTVSAFTSGNFRILLAIEPRLHASPHVRQVRRRGAALALGPAQSVTVPRGAASEYRICVSIIISAYGIYNVLYTLCAGPRPLYCMHYNYMYCLIASRGGNVLCTLSLWACAVCVYAWPALRLCVEHYVLSTKLQSCQYL